MAAAFRLRPVCLSRNCGLNPAQPLTSDLGGSARALANFPDPIKCRGCCARRRGVRGIGLIQQLERRNEDDRADDCSSASEFDGDCGTNGDVQRDGDRYRAIQLSVVEKQRKH